MKLFGVAKLLPSPLKGNLAGKASVKKDSDSEPSFLQDDSSVSAEKGASFELNPLPKSSFVEDILTGKVLDDFDYVLIDARCVGVECESDDNENDILDIKVDLRKRKRKRTCKAASSDAL